MEQSKSLEWLDLRRIDPAIAELPGMVAGIEEIVKELQDDPVSREQVMAMFVGYVRQWHGSPWKPRAIEQEFRLPIRNIEAKRASYSKTFDYAGKIDLLMSPEGEPSQVYLVDHKTSSEDISPGSVFWKRLLIASQASHYQLACHQLGIRIRGIMWDVIRKPRIRPKKIEKKYAQAILRDGLYCGFAVSQETVFNVQNGMAEENNELYFLRLMGDIFSEPSAWYAQNPVPRSDRELHEYSGEMWATAARIRESRTDGVWLKTGADHSCHAYQRPCQYLDICSGYDHVESQHWTRTDNVHPELTIIQEDGKDVLTNSSLQCFRQCNRKYFYRYELGLRRGGEDATALIIGGALHKAIEAYWKSVAAPIDEFDEMEQQLLFEERV